MEKILIPTDFSACANKAVQMGLFLAQKNNYHIHFLHITSVPVDWINMDKNVSMYPDTTKKVNECNRQLDKLVAHARGQGIESHKFLEFNKGHEAILSHVNDHQIDLVIMGSKGASGLKEFVLGSNTQKIVRMSSVPVLVVKESLPEDFDLKRIAFVSDFEEKVMDQFKLFVSLAQSWKAQLYLLFVNTPSNFTDTLTTKIKMGNYAMHAPGMVHNTFVFNDHSFEKGVQKFCKEHQIDLVGMITHGGQAGLQLFQNSLTEHMVNHLQTPLLTMHFTP